MKKRVLFFCAVVLAVVIVFLPSSGYAKNWKNHRENHGCKKAKFLKKLKQHKGKWDKRKRKKHHHRHRSDNNHKYLVSAAIGADGGIIEVTNPDSPIYGLTIEIPEGALTEEKKISAEAVDEPDNDVPYSSALFPQIDLKPDETAFEKPIQITYTITDETFQNLGVSSLDELKGFLNVYYWDEIGQVWVPLNIVEIDSVNSKVVFEINHFSVYSIVYDTYKISKVELMTPVKRNKEFTVKLYIEHSELASGSAIVSAKFGDDIESGSVALVQPYDAEKELMMTLLAPDRVDFVDLTIDGVVIPQNAKRLWKQRLVVDYDTDVSEFEDYLGENLFEKYAPVLHFAEKEGDADAYFPTDMRGVFDIGKELKRNNVVIKSNTTKDDLSVYSSISHFFDYQGETLTGPNVRVVYATATEDDDMLYLIYIFYYHHDPKDDLVSNFFAAHDADNERIVVVLKKTGLYIEPTHVVYGQHIGYKNPNESIESVDYGLSWDKGHVILEWDNVTKYGTHPYVFIAEGSHACYPRIGSYNIVFGDTVTFGEFAGGRDKWLPCQYNLKIIPRLSEISSSSEYNFLLFSGKFGDGGIVGDNPKIVPQLGWWLLLEDIDNLLNYADNLRTFPFDDSADADDIDWDGVGNECDNCPDDYNPSQDDDDNDGVGNICDDSGLPEPPDIIIIDVF